MMQVIPLNSVLGEFHFIVTVDPSAPFDPVLNSPKIESFRLYLKLSKTLSKTMTTFKVRFFQNISCVMLG